MRNLTTNMNLTAKQIRVIAFEAKGVDLNNPRFTDELSARTNKWLHEAMNLNNGVSYIVKRCLYLTRKELI